MDKRIRAALVAAIVCVLALPVAPASAGRLFVTGHDADSHCVAGGDLPQGQCHFVGVVTSYVRGGAPSPSKPLLVIDCTRINAVEAAITAGLGPIPATTMCPSKDADFKTTPLTTSRYSAIIVGSSGDQININAINTTPDSVAINARAADIATFFNQGGGVLAFAGILNGDGNPAQPDTYYRFLPVPLNGKAVTGPFSLTPGGIGIGLQDAANGIGANDDINCCPTHNSFLEPAAGSPLQVAERDATGGPESIFGEGTIGGRTIVSGPLTGQIIGGPSTSKCVRRRNVRLKIRQPGNSRIKKATVYVNGKRVKVLKRKAFGSKQSLTINIGRLPSGTARVRIVVRTTKGVTHRSTRKYRTCTRRKHKS